MIVASQNHIDDLLHELRVVRSGQQSGSAPVPEELADLIDSIIDSYAGQRQASHDQAEKALAQGRDTVDIELDLPPEAAEAAPALLGLLDQADELCRQQKLLTLAPPPEVVAFRRWANDELIRQLQGGEPEPCPVRPTAQ